MTELFAGAWAEAAPVTLAGPVPDAGPGERAELAQLTELLLTGLRRDRVGTEWSLRLTLSGLGGQDWRTQKLRENHARAEPDRAARSAGATTAGAPTR